MPAPAEVIFEIVGFCNVEVNPFGPDQLQLVAPVAAPVKVNSEFSQIGFGEAEAETPEGILLIVIAKTSEAGPFPHILVPETVRFPEVADEEKSAVIELVPEPDAMLKPVPEYVHV